MSVKKGVYGEPYKYRMEYKKFLIAVKRCIEVKMGEGYKVSLHHITKNNGTKLDGITLMKTDFGISPNIYLNHFYKDYCNGKSIEEISKIILNAYQTSMNQNEYNNSNLENFFDFETIKSKIVYRLVNYSQNRKLLQQVPFIRFLDLAVVFYYVVKNESNGIGSIRISHEYMNAWEINIRTVMKLAKENTAKMFPAKIYDMEDIVKEFYTEEIMWDNGVKMYVLSNANGINGASALLYSDAMMCFSKEKNSDFYVLPSSIHEVILIPYSTDLDREEIRKTVFDVNRTQVLPEEILSNEVYIYRRKTNSLEI